MTAAQLAGRLPAIAVVNGLAGSYLEYACEYFGRQLPADRDCPSVRAGWDGRAASH
jgi:hypothetical protein